MNNREEIEYRISVMQAYLDGKHIETATKGEQDWDSPIENNVSFDFWGHLEYRVAIEKPSINWDHVSKDYNYLATDKDGRSYLFKNKNKPNLLLSQGSWMGTPNSASDAEGLSSFKKGDCDWKDSLVSRPGF
jgi:hypothetical protein